MDAFFHFVRYDTVPGRRRSGTSTDSACLTKLLKSVDDAAKAMHDAGGDVVLEKRNMLQAKLTTALRDLRKFLLSHMLSKS